jgi:hypothetical protein
LPSKNEKFVQLWAIGFTAAGIAAFVGGSYHGLALVLAPSIIRSLWNITILAIGISSGFMVSGFLVARGRYRVLWLKSGLAITLFGLVLQQSAIRYHNDIYHFIQTVALYLFFRGVKSASSAQSAA